jgi:hypothetical protein
VIRVKLTHTTDYTYDCLGGLSPHVVRLRPAVHTQIEIGQASYPQVPPIKPTTGDFPHTLDLRREG